MSDFYINTCNLCGQPLNRDKDLYNTQLQADGSTYPDFEGHVRHSSCYRIANELPKTEKTDMKPEEAKDLMRRILCIYREYELYKGTTSPI